MSKPKPKSESAIGDQFVAHTLERMKSPAWRHLPDKARRLLDRIEFEHLQHGGAENGKLVVTYTNFQKWGIGRRNDITLSIRQCVGLGFLEVTEQGGRSISDRRWPSRYRLTYVLSTEGSDGPPPTHEWRHIRTDADAIKALARVK